MITLLNDYYRIDKKTIHGDATLFDITLLPGYDAYEGHFPCHPVAPAVCSIQMMKECAAQLAGRPLFLSTITKCRFSAMIIPLTTPQLQLRMQLTNEEVKYLLQATLYDASTTYIEFKGELTTV